MCFNTLRDLKNVEPTYNIFLILGLIFGIITSVLLFTVATKDPATIPMREFLEKSTNNKLHVPTEHSLYRRKYLAVHGPFLTKMKYCQTCDIFRPPRTVHCGICECCIERLDHHCPWLGTCVGKRNYKYFICFVTMISILLIKGVIFTIIHILEEKCYD